jgi:hypothetical protein
MAVDREYGSLKLPLVECAVTFLTPDQGGRRTPFAPDALRGNHYRPHIVVGDPSQRHALIDDRGSSAEEYIGVAFSDGPTQPELGAEMRVVLTLMYFPHQMYDRLIPGTTFTMREGSTVVAYGHVCRWLE